MERRRYLCCLFLVTSESYVCYRHQGHHVVEADVVDVDGKAIRSDCGVMGRTRAKVRESDYRT